MLLRSFFHRRKALMGGLLLLSLGVGLMEGLFILIAKSAVTGMHWRTWSVPLLILAMVVTLRSLSQVAAARLELRGVFAWLAERRGRLLEAAATRRFPAYRDPWRNTLVTSLGSGMDDLSDGLGAGFRCLAAVAQAAALAPVLFLFSWKLAAAAFALAAPAWLASRVRARMLAAAAEGWSNSKAGLALDLENFGDGLEADAGNAGLREATGRLGRELDRHAGTSRRWETAKAVFPPALEWFFFMSLAGLALFAGGAGGAGDAGVQESPVAGGAAGLLPFGALLLLLYRPIREWARNHPVYALGNGAFLSLGNLQATLEAYPLRGPRPQSPSGLVTAEGVRFGYGEGDSVFADFDMALDPGELTWVTGRNGAGKSTLLKLIADIEPPQSGRLLLPPGLDFAYLPQRAFLGPGFGEWLRGFRTARPEAWRELDSILGVEAITAKAGGDGRWEGLSGGEKQRLALARVFASEAGYLLLDEPTTWLTASDRERVLGDLLAIWRRPRADGSIRGGALVSHEPFLGEFCARSLRLETPRAEAVA